MHPFVRSSRVAIRLALLSCAGWAVVPGATYVVAQDKPGDAKPAASKPADGPLITPRPIADEPRTIDAATLVPDKLRKPTTAMFAETALGEVAEWLQKQTGLNVSLDVRSLEAVGVDANSPVTDRLQEAPAFLLLDRLAAHRIGWRLDGGVLRLYGLDDDSVLYNEQYNIGDLLDQKFDEGEIQDALQATLVAKHGWVDDGGAGDMVLLGDMLFIRQDARAHRRIAGLLAALRAPARRVLVDEPASHAQLRAALAQATTVAYKAKPLGAVIDDLAKTAGIDLRLDRSALQGTKITERVPVTFELREQSVRTTLDLLLGQLKLSWVLRDGAIYVVPLEGAESYLKTAVFDVRDMCPDGRSSSALQDALERQVKADGWNSDGGEGAICFAAPGVMVVKQTERGQDAILELLERYRIALRNSKRRISPEEDPEAVVTRYYRLPSDVAEDLEKQLPTLIHPDSWKSAERPQAIGTIRRLRSWSRPAAPTDKSADKPSTSIPYSILVIEQKRKVHEEIPSLLLKIEHGDLPAQGGVGGMGGGMGGMGGGIF